MNNSTIKLITAAFAYLITVKSHSQVCIQLANTREPITWSYSNAVIEGHRISNTTGNCIVLYNVHNLIIKNCILGPSLYEAIKLVNCSNITITNCIFKDNGNGVYAENCIGIKVIRNQFSNVQYSPNRGQFVQFNNVSGPGNEVSDNVGENIWGSSSSEDLISMYKSNGTPSSPILIKGNRFRGGGPGANADGGSCGGIMAGDQGGSYISVQDNILVDPGQYGVAISGGTHNELLRNKVYSAGTPINNIGMYVINYSGRPCNTHLVEGNVITYYNKEGRLNDFATLPNCAPITAINNDLCRAEPCPLNADILPKRLLCPELSAHYKFDVYNWKDETGSKLTPSPNGASIIYPCDGNSGAAHFSGNNQFLNIPRSPWLKPTSQKITVSSWIKRSLLQGIKAIARSQDADGWNDGWRILLIDGYINARIITYQGAAECWSSSLQPDAWNHIAMTYDGAALKIYLNGVLQNSTAVAGKIIYKPTPINMTIGKANGDYYFNGMMDEFRFTSGDLTGEEILNEYNTTSGMYNTPHPPSMYITYRDNNDFHYASSYNSVHEGAIYLNASAAHRSDYTWDVHSGNNYSFFPTGNVGNLYLNYLGDFYATVTATNDCGGSISQSVYFIADQTGGMAMYNAHNHSIEINMNKQLVRKSTGLKDPGNYHVELYNSQGQLVKKASSRNESFQLDVSRLPSGVYYLNIINGQSKTVKKIIISK